MKETITKQTKKKKKKKKVGIKVARVFWKTVCPSALRLGSTRRAQKISLVSRYGCSVSVSDPIKIQGTNAGPGVSRNARNFAVRNAVRVNHLLQPFFGETRGKSTFSSLPPLPPALLPFILSLRDNGTIQFPAILRNSATEWFIFFFPLVSPRIFTFRSSSSKRDALSLSN